MAESYFYGKKKGQERKITIRTATLLVGKAPTKAKRIKMSVALPLTGQKMTGTPPWIVDAFEFVSKTHSEVVEPMKLSGYDIAFSDDNLFAKGANTTKAVLNGFKVCEYGDAENPDVQLVFNIYAPFSTALWKHVGQYGGEEQYARFEQQEVEEEEFELEAEGEDADDEAVEYETEDES